MTELSIHIPKELSVSPETLISEQQLPLIPADRLKGIIHPDRLPFLAARITDVDAAIEMHEGDLDPHPQYAKDTDLTAHASNQELHLHEGAIGNEQVADDAAIAWSKIDKSGAAAAEVGAAASSHTHTGLVIESATAPSNPTVGQRWRDNSDYQVWYWSGQYWMSEQVFLAVASIFSTTTTAAYGILPASNSYNFYLLSMSVEGLFNSPQNTTDYWTFQLERRTQNSSANVTIATLAGNIYAITSGALNLLYSIPSIGLHQDLIALNASGYRLALYRQGAGGSLSHLALSLTYRRVKR